ncbi:hypothetical protein HDU98_000353, partial [Podochytrium sp. JEL0797]
MEILVMERENIVAENERLQAELEIATLPPLPPSPRVSKKPVSPLYVAETTNNDQPMKIANLEFKLTQAIAEATEARHLQQAAEQTLHDSEILVQQFRTRVNQLMAENESLVEVARTQQESNQQTILGLQKSLENRDAEIEVVGAKVVELEGTLLTQEQRFNDCLLLKDLMIAELQAQQSLQAQEKVTELEGQLRAQQQQFNDVFLLKDLNIAELQAQQ